MSDVIRFKRSGVTGAAPSDLALGEPAYNYADNKLFFKDAAGSIVEFGGSGGGLVTAATPAAFPATGSATSLYVATDSQQAYRWDTTNSVYVEVGPVGGGGTSWVTAPASATASGTAGQVAYDGSYFYVCTATDTWVRTRLGTWPGDQYFSDVSLLLNFDGSGSAIEDLSRYPKTIAAVGNATQSATQSKWGGKSLYLDGDGDYVTIPYSSDLDISSGDWTVEAWVRLSSLKDVQDIWRVSTGGYQGQYHQCGLAGDANGAVYFLTAVSSDQWASSTPSASGTLVANQWQHVAAVRSGTTFRLYVDGTSVLTYTYSGNLHSMTGQTEIGANAGFASDNTRRFSGYIDDLRVTKIARYTGSTITVPSAAFPNS